MPPTASSSAPGLCDDGVAAIAATLARSRVASSAWAWPSVPAAATAATRSAPGKMSSDSHLSARRVPSSARNPVTGAGSAGQAPGR
jgi:hypothetical protein